MKQVKIVIGANFGDEGKGLTTDYFAYEAKKLNVPCLVVCHNGGSQKGHTVVTPSGIRHVFHHFGSGCFAGADTYLSEEYVINPITFQQEIVELYSKNIITKCYINKKARITTPFDMMMNQIAEEFRGLKKHGSCGLGIYEAIIRDKIHPIAIDKFYRMNDTNRRILLLDMANQYFFQRLKHLQIDFLPRKWREILSQKDEIIDHYIRDFHRMMKQVSLCDDSIMDNYEYLIFEGAQGLLLDQNNVDFMPHLTPSNTGILNPIKIISNLACNIEVCYVTRTYMTRHGAGRFESECNKAEISDNLVDFTNVPNPFQDTIRYGKLDITLLLESIKNDLFHIPQNINYITSLMITHTNETNSKIISTDGDIDIHAFIKENKQIFDKIYLSGNITRNHIDRI